ncbi:HAMP domain-containing histidine kinase [Candidatus Nomurabacteria bacterium]|nr:HAMP domain-containing histidine kinase [Candidatus Nomurabacteria bacterium]
MKTSLKQFTEWATDSTRSLKDNLFQSARLKLTGYYIVIMFIILAIFSSVLIYTIDSRLKQDLNGRVTVRNVDGTTVDVDEIVEVLVYYIDGILILIITFLSYFLAGKTLKPIEENFDDQKKFYADISHDLRTPIAIIATESEVALQNTSNDEKELRKIIVSNLEEARKMSKLVSDMLVISRDGRKSITNKFTVVDLYAFVQRIMSKMEAQAKKKGLKLVLGESKKTPVKIYVTDFERVIMNILQNAINYTEVGSIRVYVTSDDKNAHVLISDTGVGIKEEDLPFVCDRFYKAEHSRGDDGGFGLGLSISKQIIEQHNGSINIESELNVGTTIVITIPKN